MRINNKLFSVYIVTNELKTVFYTGMTNNLYQRIGEHYLDRISKTTFAGKYNAYWLLYFETHEYVLNAIAREKEIKGWSRIKKLNLIKQFNPSLEFLNKEVFGEWPVDVYHRGGGEMPPASG